MNRLAPVAATKDWPIATMYGEDNDSVYQNNLTISTQSDKTYNGQLVTIGGL